MRDGMPQWGQTLAPVHILAVFGTGVAVGKIVEKIERLERKEDRITKKGRQRSMGCR